MSNTLKTVMITLIFLAFTAVKTNAAVLSSQYLMDQIKKSVIEQVKANTKGQVTAEINGLPYKSIEVPDGKVKIATSFNSKHFNPITVVKVDILVDGENVKSFGAPVKLYVHDNVWVAKDVINRGESLSGSNLELKRKELGLITESAARQDFPLFGCLSRKNYTPGDIIDTRYMETVPVVMKNSPVSVIFKSISIDITISAQALNDGKIGDYVRVRSKQYRKDYIGKVVGANTVLVNI